MTYRDDPEWIATRKEFVEERDEPAVIALLRGIEAARRMFDIESRYGEPE